MPSAILVTGPVIVIEKSLEMSMPILPPGMWTVMSLSTRPSLWAAQAAAQELEPEARV